MKQQKLKLISFTVIAILCGINLNAQDSLSYYKNRYSISFLAETFTNPGLNVGYHRLLKQKRKEKTKRNGKVKVKYYEFLWDNHFGFYNHKRNHTGIVVTSGVSLSRIKQQSGFWNIGVFVGTLHKLINEDVYTVDDNGEVVQKRFSENTNFAFGLKTQIGQDLSFRKSKTPIIWYLGSNLLYATSFTKSIRSHIILEIGINYKLK